MSTPTRSPVPWRVIVRRREFRGLLVAQVLSEWGDAIARVALAALILARTDSAFLAALAFVVSYAPAVLGAALLGSLADRLPRKTVLIGCDAVRAALLAVIALLAVPGTTVAALLALLFVAEVFTAPFEAARGAVLPDVLPDAREYVSGAGLMRMLSQVDQVVGLVVAGAVVAALTARTALALDALTFGVSVLVLATSLRSRPAAAVGGAGGPGRLVRDFREGAAVVFGDPVRRALVVLAWGMALALVAPEAVALAYAREAGESTAVGAALLAAVPAGAAVGAALIARLDLNRQVGAIVPLAGAACVPLLATVTTPPVWVAGALWFLCGLLQAFMLPVLATVNLVTPRAFRGRANGLAASGFSVSTAVAFLLAGSLADVASPALAVASGGAIGVGMVALAWLAWPSAALQEAVSEAYVGRRA